MHRASGVSDRVSDRVSEGVLAGAASLTHSTDLSDPSATPSSLPTLVPSSSSPNQDFLSLLHVLVENTVGYPSTATIPV